MRIKPGHGTPRGWADAWLAIIWPSMSGSMAFLVIILVAEHQCCTILPVGVIGRQRTCLCPHRRSAVDRRNGLGSRRRISQQHLGPAHGQPSRQRLAGSLGHHLHVLGCSGRRSAKPPKGSPACPKRSPGRLPLRRTAPPGVSKTPGLSRMVDQDVLHPGYPEVIQLPRLSICSLPYAWPPVREDRPPLPLKPGVKFLMLINL